MKLEDIILFSLSFEGNIWMNRGSKGLKFIYLYKQGSILLQHGNHTYSQNKLIQKAK